MLTTSQNNRLDSIMKNNKRCIRDLALLAVASSQNHPKITAWRCAPGGPIFNFDVAPTTKPVLLPFLQPLTQMPVFCLQYIGDCYYIGMGTGPILCTKTLRDLLSTHSDPETLCMECLCQISSVLRHLDGKGIPYVHGNLTVDSVVQSLDGRFYIVDNGFPKLPVFSDPFACYRLLNHDLRTLCESMSSFVNTKSVLMAILSDRTVEFKPAMFDKYLEDNMLVFKRLASDTK